MAFTVNEFPGAPFRTLVVEADSQEEIVAATAKALLKGWAELAAGTVPDTGRLSIWFSKPVAAPQALQPR